jgi:hypothetical protein
VTEDGFCLPPLPPVRVLAWCSAAWQFNVVPDRGRITRLGLKAGREKLTPPVSAVVSARNADALSLTSGRLLWPGWLTLPGLLQLTFGGGVRGTTLDVLVWHFGPLGAGAGSSL